MWRSRRTAWTLPKSSPRCRACARSSRIGPGRWRLLSDGDVRPQAAAAVVNAGGALRRLSVEEPSLDAIYARYFQKHGVQHAA